MVPSAWDSLSQRTRIKDARTLRKRVPGRRTVIVLAAYAHQRCAYAAKSVKAHPTLAGYAHIRCTYAAKTDLRSVLAAYAHLTCAYAAKEVTTQRFSSVRAPQMHVRC